MTEEKKSAGGLGTVVLIVVLVLSVATGVWFGLRFYGGALEEQAGRVELTAGTLLAQPKSLEDFELTGDDNRPLDRESLKGRWTFLSFGYTHCPDVCPTLMATFDAIDKALAGTGAAERPGFLFVSVDPERDTPQRAGEYASFFSPHIRGATAGHDVLRPLTTQLGILYQRAEGQETAMGYLVDHSASVLLLDPQARLAAIFSAPHDPQVMAADFLRISSNLEPQGND